MVRRYDSGETDSRKCQFCLLRIDMNIICLSLYNVLAAVVIDHVAACLPLSLHTLFLAHYTDTSNFQYTDACLSLYRLAM